MAGRGGSAQTRYIDLNVSRELLRTYMRFTHVVHVMMRCSSGARLERGKSRERELNEIERISILSRYLYRRLCDMYVPNHISSLKKSIVMLLFACSRLTQRGVHLLSSPILTGMICRPFK